MKKLIALAVGTLSLFTITSCDEDNDSTDNGGNSSTTEIKCAKKSNASIHNVGDEFPNFDDLLYYVDGATADEVTHNIDMSTAGIYSYSCSNYEANFYVVDIYEINADEYLNYVTVDDEIYIISYVNSAETYNNLAIPSEIDGLPVTTIVSDDAYGRTFVHSDEITIPYTVTTIYEDAFKSMFTANVIIEYNETNAKDRFDSYEFPHFITVSYVNVA